MQRDRAEPNRLGSLLAGSLRWSTANRRRVSQVVAAALGLSVPALLGAVTGRLGMGLAASFGGLAMAGVGEGETPGEQAASQGLTLILGGVAILFGAAVGRHGALLDLSVPLVALAAGVIGRISRPLAGATTRFMLFTVIATGMGESGGRPASLAALFVLGAALTAGLSMVLRPLDRLRGVVSSAFPGSSAPDRRRYTARQLLKRWFRGLAELDGWQYGARIALCLTAAEALDFFLPGRNAYWVGVTVVITLPREVPGDLARLLERALGTVFGVVIASLLLLWTIPVWLLVSVVALLAAARTILKEANYTAYAALMTPLVMLLLGFGRKVTVAIIAERLLATCLGCAVALTLGYLLWVNRRTRASGFPDG